MAEGTYTMNVDSGKKTIAMTVSGTFTPEKNLSMIMSKSYHRLIQTNSSWNLTAEI